VPGCIFALSLAFEHSCKECQLTPPSSAAPAAADDDDATASLKITVVMAQFMLPLALAAAAAVVMGRVSLLTGVAAVAGCTAVVALSLKAGVPPEVFAGSG
jgi:hypothetical protein